MAGWDDRPCNKFFEVEDRDECASCGWSFSDHQKGAKMTETKSEYKPGTIVSKIEQTAYAAESQVQVLEEFLKILLQLKADVAEIKSDLAEAKELLTIADEDRKEVIEKLDNLNLPGVDFGFEG